MPEGGHKENPLFPSLWRVTGVLFCRNPAIGEWRKRLNPYSRDNPAGYLVLTSVSSEIICNAKLQHCNLVKLLGYCNHRTELILAYECMRNKSLDKYLFDESRSWGLDWPQRFNIIQGMARGILYLHQDSRLQIIHRDLKAGNILLDGDMNPQNLQLWPC
ncbi:putative protein kinase RLK-Pelle-DLSV family [Helianthus annuus]|nr:putative protein kinase RLK-Pelle-DLSV family [Helianthus annuus]KAJ0897108.1 putative protein kinase RLK-Pelle-DLSV family [Helianthus annuus]